MSRFSGAEGSDPSPPKNGIPVGLADLARAAFATRDHRAEVADVESDSLDDATADPADRTVRFTAGERRITVSRTGRQLLVETDDAGGAVLHVETQRDGTPAISRDGPGRWIVEPVPDGPASLVLLVGERRIRTSWTRW